MALLLSNYTAALKEILLPYIRNNFPKQTILLDQVKRNAGVSVINDEFVAPVYTTRHGGVANLANDGNNLNAASGRSTSRGTVAPKIITGAMDISKLAIDASQGNTLAVENALVAQTKTLADDYARHVNRQLYSDGVGAVSQVLGSVSGTEVSVTRPDSSLDDGRSTDWYGSVNGDIDPLKYVANGNIIGVGTGAAAVGTVSSISTGTSIQLTGATASAANDTIYVLDGSLGGAGTSEVQGIRAALSSSTGTSTYAGLARSTTGWTPQFGSVSEALTLTRMENKYLAATEYASLSDQFAILVNKTLFQKYGDLLTAMRREVNKTDLLGGWTGLEFAAGAKRVGVFLDFDVPDGEVIILNLDTWTICQVSDMDWLEDPNGGGLLRLQNTIKYQAAMVWFVNTICLAPAANARLTQKTG